MKSGFTKFPTTPHLAVLGDIDIRHDKVFTSKERAEFLSRSIIVEEKIDGANLGVSCDDEGAVVLQNRGNILRSPFVGQWKKLDEWLMGRTSLLFELLGTSLIVFGEWCYAQHSVHYTSLPDWFLGFDVYDRAEDKFLSTGRRNQLLNQLNMFSVPQITSGIMTLDDMLKLSHKSRFADQSAEGVYLRQENERWLEKRAKLVRPEFVQNMNMHWSRSGIIQNQTVPSQS